MAETQGGGGLGAALAKIPSGVSVATATHEGRSAGLLASWIQQISFEPPMVCLAVRRGRPIEPVIDGSGKFVLNVVGEGGTAVFKRFSRGVAPGQPAFEGTEVEQSDAGPVLAECIAHLACRVVGKHPAGDHHLYVAEVTGGDATPFVKPHVHLRDNGFSY